MSLVIAAAAACASKRVPAVAQPAPSASVSEAEAPSAEKAAQPIAIRLPADDAPHDAPVEWWYYTGRLTGDAGEQYGFEFVIFQVRRGNRAMYMAHFAVTDLARGTFYHELKTEVASAPTSSAGIDLTVGDWHLAGNDGRFTLHAQDAQYALELTFVAQKPPVVHYGDGAMNIGSDEPFYYYSYPRMTATGSITAEGVATSVIGTAWMDHQWGVLGRQFQGWDWFSLRLDDNTEVMVFQVKGESAFVGGTFVASDGTAQDLAPDAIKVTPTGEWTSPDSGARYPHGWTVRIPTLALEVTVTPTLAGQEFTKSIFGTPIYWEGLCGVDGTRDGKAVQGHGYVELVGY